MSSLVLPATSATPAKTRPGTQRLEELLHLRQRRETRVLAEFPVQAHPHESPARRRDASNATALNVSSRGMLLETPELLPRGARAELTLRASAATVRRSPIVGEVVRTAETADGHQLAGVHFVVVRKEARLAVRDYLRATVLRRCGRRLGRRRKRPRLRSAEITRAPALSTVARCAWDS